MDSPEHSSKSRWKLVNSPPFCGIQTVRSQPAESSGAAADGLDVASRHTLAPPKENEEMDGKRLGIFFIAKSYEHFFDGDFLFQENPQWSNHEEW